MSSEIENFFQNCQSYQYYCYRKVGGLAAHRPKANKQARLVKRKVCFISDACNQRGEGGQHLFKGLLPSPPTPLPLDKQGVRPFIDRVRQGRLHAETAQSALTAFKLVISGLTSVILIVLGTVVSVPGSICSHFFEAGSRNCGSLCPGYSLVIVQSTSSTWVFRIYETAHRIRLRNYL